MNMPGDDIDIIVHLVLVVTERRCTYKKLAYREEDIYNAPVRVPTGLSNRLPQSLVQSADFSQAPCMLCGLKSRPSLSW